MTRDKAKEVEPFIGQRENTFENAMKVLSENMQDFIAYLEATKPSQWYLHKVRSKGNTKNCLYGHLINWYYGKDYMGDMTAMWDAFEEVGTTFYVYPINDGQNPKYPQKTARERCIAYLTNIYKGEELWTAKAMEVEWQAYKAAELQKKEQRRANTKPVESKPKSNSRKERVV